MCSGRITQSCSQKFHKVFLCGSSIQQKWVNNVVTKCMQSLQYFVKAEKKHGLVRGAMPGAVEGSTGAARPCRKSPKAVLDPVKGGCRHAYCPLCTYAQFWAAQNVRVHGGVKMCTACAHMLAPLPFRGFFSTHLSCHCSGGQSAQVTGWCTPIQGWLGGWWNGGWRPSSVWGRSSIPLSAWVHHPHPVHLSEIHFKAEAEWSISEPEPPPVRDLSQAWVSVQCSSCIWLHQLPCSNWPPAVVSVEKWMLKLFSTQKSL